MPRKTRPTEASPTIKDRINAEIAAMGGERNIPPLYPEDRLEWEQQAIVLSFFREHGDLHRAAVEGGQTPARAAHWYAKDVHGFRERHKQAFGSVGHALQATLVRRIMNGEIKAPGIVMPILKAALPEIYGGELEGNTHALKLMEKLRDMNLMPGKAQVVEGQKASEADAPAEDEVLFPISDIGKLLMGGQSDDGGESV